MDGQRAMCSCFLPSLVPSVCLSVCLWRSYVVARQFCMWSFGGYIDHWKEVVSLAQTFWWLRVKGLCHQSCVANRAQELAPDKASCRKARTDAILRWVIYVASMFVIVIHETEQFLCKSNTRRWYFWQTVRITLLHIPRWRAGHSDCFDRKCIALR